MCMRKVLTKKQKIHYSIIEGETNNTQTLPVEYFATKNISPIPTHAQISKIESTVTTELLNNKIGSRYDGQNSKLLLKK